MRIKSYDSLKGLMIFFVILGHLALFSYKATPLPLLVRIVTTFHVGVFMCISGYFFKVSEESTYKEIGLSVLKKVIYLLIPTVFFYVLYSSTHGVNSLTFLSDGFGYYWFLPALFFCFLIVSIFIVIIKLLKINKYIKGGDVFLLIMVIMVSLICLKGIELPLPGFIEQGYLYFYFPIFCIGYLARRNKELVNKVIRNNMATTIAISLLFVLYLYRFLGLKEHFPQLIDGLIEYSKLFLWVFVCISCALYYRKFFDGNSRVNNFLVLVGKYTLPIYVLHYFFLPDLAWLKNYLGDNNSVILILILTIIAVAIIYLCLLITTIVSRSDFLGHYLLGQKSERFKI